MPDSYVEGIQPETAHNGVWLLTVPSKLRSTQLRLNLDLVRRTTYFSNKSRSLLSALTVDKRIRDNCTRLTKVISWQESENFELYSPKRPTENSKVLDWQASTTRASA